MTSRVLLLPVCVALASCGGVGEDVEDAASLEASTGYGWANGTRTVRRGNGCNVVDTITTPHHGVKVLERVRSGSGCNDPLRIFVARANLARGDLAVRATAHADRGKTPSAWGSAKSMLVAVNANFYDHTPYSYHPTGLAISGGRVWPETEDSTTKFIFAAGEDTVDVVANGPEPWMKHAVSGHPRALTDGKPPAWACTGACAAREPRTAAGVSAERSLVFFAVVDGRAPGYSVGMSQLGLGAVLHEVGAADVVNLDGGGSSALWVKGRGVLNRPSDGSQRVVSNHLGIRRIR